MLMLLCILVTGSDFTPYKMEKVLSKEQLNTKISTGSFYQMSDSSYNEEIIINNIQLGYYVDVIDYKSTNYLHPVFIIQNKDFISGGIEYEAIIPILF